MYPWPPAKQCPPYEGSSPLRADLMLAGLDSTLIDIAIQLSHESKKSFQLVDRLRDPFRTWRKNMGRFVGSERVSAGSLRLKRNCDWEVMFDDEGEVDNTIADEEALGMREKIDERRPVGPYEYTILTAELTELQTCDNCRLEHTKCEKSWSSNQGSISSCNFCFKNKKRCSVYLAQLNNYWLSLSLASLPLASTSPTDQIIPSHAGGGLTALPLQPALEPMPITQRQQAIRQKQHPDYSPIAEQSLFSVAGRTAFSPRSVASSRTEEPLYTPGNTSYTDLSLSQQLPPETSLYLLYTSPAETLLILISRPYDGTQPPRRSQDQKRG